MARVAGASIVITGASSGIGEATAYAAARKGARLTLGARRLDRLNMVAERCRELGSPEVVVRKVDIGHAADARAVIAGALQAFEQVDVLVNNAGVGWTGPFQDMPDDDISNLVATNLQGVVWTTKSVLPEMIQRRRGVIVNVASVVGFRPIPYSAVYSATKHAVVGFSHALRGELSGTGVRVAVVYPGTTATEFFSPGQPEGPIVDPPEKVARAVMRAVRWPRRDVILFPYRLAQILEPIIGGPLDHVLGEYRRRELRTHRL